MGDTVNIPTQCQYEHFPPLPFFLICLFRWIFRQPFFLFPRNIFYKIGGGGNSHIYNKAIFNIPPC